MCGRYYIDKAMFQEVEELLAELGGRKGQMEQEVQVSRTAYKTQTSDKHPGDLAPVLVNTMDGVKLEWQRWGVPGFQKGSLIFNARSETVKEKRMFQDGICRRRAVIPARWFYEWNRAKEKITFFERGKPVLYLAGFSSLCEDGEHFVILTTGANDSMKKTHDRMPLILEEKEIAEWLEDEEEWNRLLKKQPGELEKEAEYEQLSFLDFQNTY